MRKICCCAALFAALFHGPVVAQDKEVWEEYGKRVERSREVSPLGPDLLGDQASLSDGSLSFQATDVDIPGNSALPVSFSRKYAVTDRSGRYRDSPLADWDIDVPSISGVFAPDWVSASPTPQNRCSAAPAPPTVSIQGSSFYPIDYWQGIHLNLPGGSGGELLRTNAGAPKPSAGNYIWVTGDGTTHVSCLGSIANGTGEGFLAITADGTRYWFNWMAQYMEPVLKATNGTGRIPRRKNVLYATRVEDRFGNRVDYTYTNAWNAPARLTRIQANDGRTLTISYNGNGFVSTVGDGARTWTYSYTSSSLSAVELPDGSRWEIALSPLSSARIMLFKMVGVPPPGSPGWEPWRNCVWQPEAVGQTEFTGSITHPSGATGQFTVEVERHGRTNVPVNCLNYTSPHNDVNDDISFWPITYDNFALKTKTITGPGLPPATWQYDYHSPPSYYYPSGSSSHPVCPVGTDCSIPQCTSDDCAGASRTTVTGPEGKWTRYWHGNSYRYNEGKLLSVETGAGPSSVLKRTTNSYDLNNTLRFGTSPQQRGDGFASEYVRPQLAAVVAQQGVDFTWQANAFDAFARPTSVTKSSTVTGNPIRTEVAAYHDNLSKWVLGQAAKLTVNGIVASETTYNSNASPAVRKQFGRTVETLTYNADGTVRTVKDGNNRITTLGSWYRGIPRAITYADGASQSAVVNASGWITRVTDENGFATNYAYDPMGRLSRITYPTGDAVAWNATTISFAKSTTGVYGIPAGHWRQVVGSGDSRKVTYFDALWQPLVVREYDNANVAATERFIRYAYDHAGRVTFASYPSASYNPTAGTRTVYDALGRQTSVTQSSELGLLRTTTEYLAGFQARVTDPRGNQTHYRYLAWDQPTTDFITRIVQPEGVYTYSGRDAFGKPMYTTRRNADGSTALARRYVYDAHQQLCKMIEPEVGATVLAYDGAGNLAWSAAGTTFTSSASCNTDDVPIAQRTVRAYDQRNRIKSLAFPDNMGNSTYSYTPDGLLKQLLTDNGGNLVYNNYVYNRRRLLAGESMEWGSISYGIGYGYDANGHLASHAYPLGQTVTYAQCAGPADESRVLCDRCQLSPQWHGQAVHQQQWCRSHDSAERAWASEPHT
ncbi:RHS repeat domain-containing protein [Luteimonas salinilitoris]|uniref:RHS repeat domain-containing protein n=1 Tax=Luteimonas salinilitoris TaxID=3237697 RepID=A0ABV4HPA0_9GAMM